MMVLFESNDLLPAAWRDLAHGRAVRAFNPGLLRDGDGWLLAYRLTIEPGLERRIAVCRLDTSFRVIPGSPQPLTDWVRFKNPSDYPLQARTWFADPRLYRWDGRLFVYWNSGWHEPQNCQFLQELHPSTLRPIGEPRELVLRGTRQKLEKNWALFQADGLFAVYTVSPHRVLSFSIGGDGPIEFADIAPPLPNPDGYAKVHGGLRGGAPPQRHVNTFYSFCHSIENDPAGYRYVAGVYRFSVDRPFRPTHMPRAPLPIDVPAAGRRALPKLNAAVGHVVYPAGAAFHDGKWLLSIGIDDERCALAVLDEQIVESTLQPVTQD